MEFQETYFKHILSPSSMTFLVQNFGWVTDHIVAKTNYPTPHSNNYKPKLFHGSEDVDSILW